MYLELHAGCIMKTNVVTDIRIAEAAGYDGTSEVASAFSRKRCLPASSVATADTKHLTGDQNKKCAFENLFPIGMQAQTSTIGRPMEGASFTWPRTAAHASGHRR